MELGVINVRLLISCFKFKQIVEYTLQIVNFLQIKTVTYRTQLPIGFETTIIGRGDDFFSV